MSETSVPFLSYDNFEFWAVDYVRKEITLVMRDGRKHISPLQESNIPPSSQIAATVFHWEKWWIQVVTDRRDSLFWMGFNPQSSEPGPSLPTVYLDQNMWSTVATARVDPARVTNAAEREAALELIRLASDAGVILPLASGHLLETSALDSSRRYELGLAIAELSGGWQMRHPMDVFQHEALIGLSEHLGIDPGTYEFGRPIVTTEPYAWMQNEEFGLGKSPDKSPETLLQMLTAPSVAISLLIDPEASPRLRPASWVEHHKRIAGQIAALGGKEAKRNTALRRFWNENIGFYRTAYAVLSGTNNLPGFSNRELRRMFQGTRMVSILSEMFVRRFADSTFPWEDNDLIDIFHLACGAAHCDYMAGEARTAMQIRQIQKSQGVPETSFRRLTDLVDVLRDAGTTTDTERRAQADAVPPAPRTGNLN